MTQSNSNDISTTIVIFGASGDLTERKLIPALFNLYRKGRLPKICRIVGVARTPETDDHFRQRARAGVDQFADYKFTDDEWNAFAPQLIYHTGDFVRDGEEHRLAAALKEMEDGTSHRLYYLATPPQFFMGIAAALGRAGMTDEAEGFRRVIIEKPFGTDLPSANELTTALHRVLREQQIYRIDHYLGKETVQNVLVFRFANGIFEPVWNRNYIDHVQISVLEQVGVGHRAGYYDGVGVVRDMFQNHILALLALVAMEPPTSFNATALRNERAKLLSAVRPIALTDTVRGQYKAYLTEEGVKPNSATATYAALRLFIDNWRWQDVPFYLRSGKTLKEKRSEILIQFKQPPHRMFPAPSRDSITANLLAICLQPDEGIHLRFDAKVPDTVAEMRAVDMDFNYEESFGARSIPEAYERLLLDALNGDASLFNRNDQVELAWQLLDPIIAGWQTPDAPPLAIYEQGTWGPAEATTLVHRNGCHWLMGCGADNETAGEIEG